MTVLTVTMNPSVDVAYQLNKFHLDTVNRVGETQKTAGGKGLNVTRVLKETDRKVLATGFLGGELGLYIKRKLDEDSIAHHFYDIEGETRNCIAILHEGKQTEILESGPTVNCKESVGFIEHFDSLLNRVDSVAISGSLAKGLPEDYYVELIKRCNELGKKVVLDTSGDSLLKVLQSKHKPSVIKPNIDELSQLLDQDIHSDIVSLKSYLSNELFSGIEWIIVSMGSNGMFAKHYDTYYKVDIPKIKVVNPVGSGDSTVAGIVSYLNKTDEELLAHANTLGMLNALENQTGHINMENYEKLYKQINVTEV